MAKTSISICKGKGSLRHNNREIITNNVDQSRIADNITYIREPLEVAYEKCFGQAIEEYNSRQKRSDRKISGVKGYMEQIRNSGNGEKLFYENVIQVGNMEDSGVGTAQGELCTQILSDYMLDFMRRNPNLYVFNAVLHLDEKTPHLHIDYIPLAHGYKQGLSVRNSLDRALGEQGVEGKSTKYENRTLAWQRAEKDYIEQIMKGYGLQRSAERGLKREQMTVEQYKAVTSVVRNEVKALPKQIESTPIMFDKKRVSVDKDDLERLEKRARLSMEHEKATRELVKALEQDRTSTREYLDIRMVSALEYEDRAKQKLEQAEMEVRRAEAERDKYLDLYGEQLALNGAYDDLCEERKALRQTIESLQQENNALRGQIVDLRKSIEQRVQEAVAPLMSQIKGFKERIGQLEESLAGTCQSFTNVVKAFGMLKYDEDKNGYRVKLNEKQSRLFDAIEKYTIKWLKVEGQEDLAVDVKEHIGISKGIQKQIDDLTPKRTHDYDLGR